MRQRLTIILTFVVIIGLLVLLNSLTYVKDEPPRDSEIAPNRSSYHSGPTGTRAFHDLLSESGYKVIRWRETTEKLAGDSGRAVSTFVVVGQMQVPFTEDEAEALHKWIAFGGRLILIDRDAESFLLPKSLGWSVGWTGVTFPDLDADPADATKMTENVTALLPVQPTAFTRGVTSVMPSRFASRVTIASPTEIPAGTPNYEDPINLGDAMMDPYTTSPVPITHIADQNGALLVDYSYGVGRVVVLSDPYIVSNGGIKLNDNLQLALNTLGYSGGVIAFDEYHQGKGVSGNAIASYFAGTPVLALAAQLVLLILLVLWTNARRFGRPLPLPHVDRRSSLEFVASMAELQERSRAFDLAIENIYSRTRRVLARYAGVDYNSPRSEIAERVASRSTVNQQKLETLMRQCEEAVNGRPINWRQSIDLVRRLREVERELGLQMRSREVRQAAENI
jgi:voltage-gated potassium channel Kch